MKIALVIVLFVGAVQSWADCVSFLTLSETANQDLTPVEGFQAYLQELLQKQVLTADDLQRMQSVLRATDQLENPLGNYNEPSIERDIHKENLQNYVEAFSSSAQDKANILLWLNNFVTHLIKVKQSKEEIGDLTQLAMRPIHFIKVNSNGLINNEKSWPYKKIVNTIQSLWSTSSTIINHDFEIMDAPVTQAQWAQVLKNNPSFMTGTTEVQLIEEPLTVLIDGNPIRINMDWAVNNVDFWDAVVFANKMSELHNLKPVYDVSEVQLTPGPNGGINALVPQALKINSVDGDIYKAEGYRLPTANEMHAIMKGEVVRNRLVNTRPVKASTPFLWQSDVQNQLSVLAQNGQDIYFIEDNTEWLSVNPKSTFGRDQNAAMKLERRRDSLEYSFNNVPGRIKRDRFTSFRLVRTLFEK